jgi:hypothetical protein
MAQNALLRKRGFSSRKSRYRKIFHNHINLKKSFSGLKISIEISIFRRTRRHFPKGDQIKIFFLQYQVNFPMEGKEITFRQKQCLKYLFQNL